MIRQGSIDDINAQQFLKISNYEDTVRQLDIYYAIGLFNYCLLSLYLIHYVFSYNEKVILFFHLLFWYNLILF